MDNSTRECGELEQLANAAAALDYTENMKEHQNEIPLGPLTQVITQADHYIESPKGPQFINLRSYETNQTHESQGLANLPQLPCSRLTFVPVVDSPSSSNTIQVMRPVTHFTFTEMASYEEPHPETITKDDQISLCVNDNLLQLETNINETISENIITVSKPETVCRSQPPKKGSFNDIPSSSTSSSYGTRRSAGKRRIRKPAAFRDGEIEYPSGSRVSSHLQISETGNKLFSCEVCRIGFSNEANWKQHQSEHLPVKRQGLSLELKIEIIKRINAGEKKMDLADEYTVSLATIKTIMKKSEDYLTCWKNGLFNPDSKRLKKPKREDVEQALYSWYKQSIDNGSPVSGSILCAKAVDYAQKLGHYDFKATHGWLDRFKKRKKISFGRGGSKKKVTKDENKSSTEIQTQELLGSLLPQVLIDYEPADIFAIEHVGLFHRALPSVVESLSGQKCPGGVKSKDRLSLVLCTNMVGNLKFPLLVIGKKKLPQKTSKSVHYVVNENSWLTPDIISSWLMDIDSWFHQQSRKVVVLVPSLPIYARSITLRSIRLLITPVGSSSPLLIMVVPTFKEIYRKLYLEEIMSNLTKESVQDPYYMSLTNCLKLLSRSWLSIDESMIVSGFQNIGLAKYGLWGMVLPTKNPILHGAEDIFRASLQATGSKDVTWDEFTHFDSDLQVCNLLGDDDILAKVTGLPEEESESETEEGNSGVDSSHELDRPLFTEVQDAMKGLRKYIQYQEGAQEMFRTLAHLEYIIHKSFPEQLPTPNSGSQKQF